MRRKDRELSREETLTVIRHTPHCVIATVDESGTPYATPITAVLFEGAVYFHSSSDVNGRRYQNALQNDKVSIVWIGRGETAADELPKDFSVNYASAIVEGRISLVTDEGEKKRVAKAFCLRHVPQAGEEAIDKYYAAGGKYVVFWKVTIDSLSGKARNKQGYFNRILSVESNFEVRFGRLFRIVNGHDLSLTERRMAYRVPHGKAAGRHRLLLGEQFACLHQTGLLPGVGVKIASCAAARRAAKRRRRS